MKSKIFIVIAVMLSMLMTACDSDMHLTDEPLYLYKFECETSARKIVCNWDKVTGAKGYLASLYLKDSDELLDRVQTEENTVTFENLEPETEYCVKIVALASEDSRRLNSKPCEQYVKTEAF